MPPTSTPTGPAAAYWYHLGDVAGERGVGDRASRRGVRGPRRTTELPAPAPTAR
jgi:hypothetical protein